MSDTDLKVAIKGGAFEGAITKVIQRIDGNVVATEAGLRAEHEIIKALERRVKSLEEKLEALLKS
jgi:hypothetical protein